MPRRLLLTAAALAVVLLAGCGVRTDDGKPVTEHRDVGAFSRIRVAAGVDLAVRVGPAPSLTLRGGEHAVDDITSRVEDGTLVLGDRDDMEIVLDGDRVRGEVTVPSLAGVEVRGSGDTTVRGLSSDALALAVHGSGDIAVDGRVDTLRATIAGSGDLDLAGLSAGAVQLGVHGSGDTGLRVRRALAIDTHGSGDVTARGSAGTVSVLSEGSSSLDLGDLRAQAVSIELHGSGDSLVQALGTLTVRGAGSGDVRYRGAPRVDAQVDGSADVSPVT